VAVIKYDLEDVEAGEGGEQPKPGLYTVKIAEVNDRRGQDNKNDLEVVVDFFQDEGIARVWSYLNFGESSRWKFREFTDALGLKPKGSLDPAKLVGKKVNVKITKDEFEGEYKGRVGRWLKPGEAETDEDEEPEDDTEPEADADGEEPAASGNEEDYTDWTKQDLIDEIETRELEMPSGRKTEEKLIAVLEADDAGGDGDDAEPEDDYDTWPVKDLKDEVNERGLEMPDLASGRGAAAKNKEELIGVLRSDDQHPFDADAE
jgi:hypothetical protein